MSPNLYAYISTLLLYNVSQNLILYLGTGTVLFSDSHSYMRAVAAGAIDIKCDCFHKLVSFRLCV
jgi:hypothetical protein